MRISMVIPIIMAVGHMAEMPSRAFSTANEAARPKADIKSIFVVDGVSTPLIYAEAMERLQDEPDADKSLPKRLLKVVFADRPLPAGTAKKWHILAEMAREDKLKAVEVDIDPVKKEVRRIALYHAVTGKGSPILTVSLQGSPDGYLLTDFQAASGRIKMKYATTSPQKWTRFDETLKPESFAFDLEVDVPIVRTPAIKANLTGAKAAASEPVKVVLAFEALARKGDFAGAQKYAAASFMSEMKKAEQQMGRAQMVKMIQEMTPSRTIRLKQLERVIIREGEATVTFKVQGGKETMTLIQIGGAWKVDK